MTSYCKKVTLSVIAATLCVVTAQAQAPQKTVIKNNTVSTSGQLDTGTYVLYHAGLNNGNDPDGKPAVYIVVDLCSHIPDQAHRYCVYAQGYAPLSTLTWKDAELVKVEVPDISTLQYGSGGVTDCTSGSCVGGPLPKLAFRATWTRYRGPSSSESEMFGMSKFTIRSDPAR